MESFTLTTKKEIGIMTALIIPRIPNDMNVFLSSPYLVEEIRNAIFSIG